MSDIKIQPRSTQSLWGPQIGGHMAMKTALALREQHVTYKDIAVVMRLYHGIDRSENAWRVALRAAGAPPKHYPDGKRRAFAQ